MVFNDRHSSEAQLRQSNEVRLPSFPHEKVYKPQEILSAASFQRNRKMAAFPV
jgi:hypothetical protein